MLICRLPLRLQCRRRRIRRRVRCLDQLKRRLVLRHVLIALVRMSLLERKLQPVALLSRTIADSFCTCSALMASTSP